MRSTSVLLACVFGLLPIASEADDGEGRGESVYVEGERVGTLLGFSPTYQVVPVVVPGAAPTSIRINVPAGPLTSPSLQVRSRKGYAFGVMVAPENARTVTLPLPSEGALFDLALFYDGPDCTGQTWVQVLSAPLNPNAGFSPFISEWFLREMGGVFGAPDPADPNGSYYLPRGVQRESVILRSIKVRTVTGLVCAPLAVPGPQSAYRLFPNDPRVTGVPRFLGGRVTIGKADED